MFVFLARCNFKLREQQALTQEMFHQINIKPPMPTESPTECFKEIVQIPYLEGLPKLYVNIIIYLTLNQNNIKSLTISGPRIYCVQSSRSTICATEKATRKRLVA